MPCRSRKAAGGSLRTTTHPIVLSGPPLAAAPGHCPNCLSAPLLWPRQAAPARKRQRGTRRTASMYTSGKDKKTGGENGEAALCPGS